MGERFENAFGIGIGAAPFPCLAPDGVDGADAAGERIDGIEIAKNTPLMGDGNAEAGDWKFGSKIHPIAEVALVDEKGQIHGVHAARLEGTVVNEGRFGMGNGIGDHAVDAAVAGEFFLAVKRAQELGRNLSGRSARVLTGSGIGKGGTERGSKNAAGCADFGHG